MGRRDIFDVTVFYLIENFDRNSSFASQFRDGSAGIFSGGAQPLTGVKIGVFGVIVGDTSEGAGESACDGGEVLWGRIDAGDFRF